MRLASSVDSVERLGLGTELGVKLDSKSVARRLAVMVAAVVVTGAIDDCDRLTRDQTTRSRVEAVDMF